MFAVPIYFHFFLYFLLLKVFILFLGGLGDYDLLFSGFSLLLFCCCCCCFVVVIFALERCMTVGLLFFVFVFVCACFLCLLPCLTIVKFVRWSFTDVSCTPTGISEINYLT